MRAWPNYSKSLKRSTMLQVLQKAFGNRNVHGPPATTAPPGHQSAHVMHRQDSAPLQRKGQYLDSTKSLLQQPIGPGDARAADSNADHYCYHRWRYNHDGSKSLNPRALISRIAQRAPPLLSQARQHVLRINHHGWPPKPSLIRAEQRSIRHPQS